MSVNTPFSLRPYSQATSARLDGYSAFFIFESLHKGYFHPHDKSRESLYRWISRVMTAARQRALTTAFSKICRGALATGKHFNHLVLAAIHTPLLWALCITGALPVMADNRIDTQRPDAPELATYGEHAIGVRTITLSNPDQIDILNIDPDPTKAKPFPRYDRPLTLEIWYPALSPASGSTDLRVFLRDGKTEVSLRGRAHRDTPPATDKFPLVIVSHGYPGNRFLLSHLAENLASQGYVVASIDHTDSTYRTQAAFGSTLVNRSLDQIFVLNQLANLSADSNSFLYNLVDSDNTALIGYSMGAYGAVITAGGGVTQASVELPWGAPHGTLATHLSGCETHAALVDTRIKTAIAIAPWGMNYGFWNEDSLAHIQIPMMFVSGSEDDVSGYENGVRAMWSGLKAVDRTLLTFDNANHNAAAPIPAPAEAYKFDTTLGSYISDHYSDAVWDTVRMNNIMQHFSHAWLGKHLKHDAKMDEYLDVTPRSNDGVWAKEADVFLAQHSYWKGFSNRTAKGLRLEHLRAGN